MKRFPKAFNILSCLLLIATLCQSVYATELPTTSTNPPSSTTTAPSPETPDQPQSDSLYTALYDCISKGESLVTYETTAFLSDDYTRSLIISLLDDHPDFFYLDMISMSYTASRNPDGSLISCVYEFVPVYTLDSQDKIIAAKAEWESLLSEILQIVSPSMSDLEKALVLHDYLCTNFSYDTTLTISDSYTFLKEKTGVCEAYADTYSALLTRLNIPNLFAVSVEMNHVWNVIQIDGAWYHVDITWDDPLNEQMKDQPGKAMHTAFLRSDKGMEAIGHKNWQCDVACTSEKYDNSFFGEINSAFVTDGDRFFAVSNTQKAILQCDLDTMTASPVVNLSHNHWSVWGEAAYWDALFTNLYFDGEWLYYSTPTAIKAYDLVSGDIMTICTYDNGDGYLYSMRYQNHRLICTVSKTPALTEGEFIFQTRHRYQEPAIDGIFTTSTCMECSDSLYGITPNEDNPFAITASARPTSDTVGAHDIRIVMVFDREAAKTLGTLEYAFSLARADGSKEALRFHSENDVFNEFQHYDSLSANGKRYSVDENHILLGFYVSAVTDASWSKLSLSITQTADQTVLYSSSLDYAQLIPTSAA